MNILLPWHAHLPDPRYINMVRGKRVMLDVNTLLRAVLFRESHAARLLENIEVASGAKAVISSHIQSTALHKLSELRPALVPQFSAGLLNWIKRGVIDSRTDGDPTTLPPNVAFDRTDDDIVLATALAERCHFLATLDRKFAERAQPIIDVLPPSQWESNTMVVVQNPLEVPIYAGPTEGSLVFDVLPSANTVSSRSENKLGRRHVFSSGSFGVWLSEDSWRYEMGHVEGKTHYQFPPLPLNQPISVGVSYDCAARRVIVGWDVPA